MNTAENIRNKEINITETVHNDIIEISLEGRLDANTCVDVEKFIQERIKKGLCRFVLNMEKVSFIASAGLRVILVIGKGLRRSNGDLYISNAQASVIKVFSISGLHNVLKFYDSADEAIRSFAN